MHFTSTLTVLATMLSAASTAHISLSPRQAQTSLCANLNSTTNGTNGTTPTAVNALLTSFLTSPPSTPDPATHLQIRETSMLYPLIIDGKDFASLPLLFTADVVANLSQGPVINGLPALTAALTASVAKVDSHHQLGTQVIESSGCTAKSVTYFTASLLGKGEKYGEVVYALGQYQDSWVKGDAGWRIKGRDLVYISPFIGNASIVTG